MALLVNTSLLFLYLWSLDETVRLTITVNASQIVARVGNDQTVLHRGISPGAIRIYAAPLSTFHVQTGGEVPVRNGIGPFTGFDEWMRQAGPGAGWSDLALSVGRDFRVLESWTNHPGVAKNARGEAVLRTGDSTYITNAPRLPYSVTADLNRPDVPEGIVVENGGGASGYLFLLRLDQLPHALDPLFPRQYNAEWRSWPGKEGRLIKGVWLPDIQTVAMSQRVARTLLTSALVGAFIVAGVLVVCGPLWWMFAGMRRKDSQEKVKKLRGRISIAPTLLVGGTFVMSSLFATVVMRIPHTVDEVAYLFQAKTLASGHLTVGAPALPSFFREEFVPVFHGHWFGVFPPGWPALLAIGVLLHVPWLINALLAAGTIAFIYATASALYSRAVALAGAAVAASSPLFIELSGTLMSHTAEVFFLSAFSYFLVRYIGACEQEAVHRTGMRWPALAGVSLGLAFLTRQLDPITFALPWLALVLAGRRTRKPAPLIVFGACASIPAFLLLAYNSALTGAPLRFPFEIGWPFDRFGFGPSAGPHGLTVAQGLWNTWYNLQSLQANLFGWPFYFALAFAFVPFLLGRVASWDIVLAASALLVVAGYTLYWHPGGPYPARYYLAALPCISILTARGFQELVRLPLHTFGKKFRRSAAMTSVAVLISVLLVFNLTAFLPAQLPLYAGYSSMSASPSKAVANAHINNALVFVESNGRGDWQSYADVFWENAPDLHASVIFARDEGRRDVALEKHYPGRYYLRMGVKLGDNGKSVTSSQNGRVQVGSLDVILTPLRR